jgi:hypothetical protein
MTLVCPHCGGALELIPGAIRASSAPEPGADSAEQLAQTGAESARLGADSADLALFAHGFELQDLEPSTNGARAKDQVYPYDFEVFWKLYPLRKGKRKALKAWRAALARLGAELAQTGATPGATPGAIRADAVAQLASGAKRYAEQVDREGIERIKYAEGWLNDDRWEDEDAPIPTVRRAPDPPRPLTSGEMDRYIEEAVWRDE